MYWILHTRICICRWRWERSVYNWKNLHDSVAESFRGQWKKIEKNSELVFMLLHVPYAQAQTNQTGLGLLCVKVWMKHNNISQLLQWKKKNRNIQSNCWEIHQIFSELLKSIRNFFVCEKFTINFVLISMENSWIILLLLVTDTEIYWIMMLTHNIKNITRKYFNHRHIIFSVKKSVSLRQDKKNLRTKNKLNTLRLMKKFVIIYWSSRFANCIYISHTTWVCIH